MAAARVCDAGIVVAITGAGQGIGRGLALAFARGAARAVVVSDIDADACEQTASELRGLGIEALAVRADVTRGDDCVAMVDAAARAFGRLDVMVCNAGIAQVRPFMELSGDDWDRMLGVNVKGTFLTLQAAARRMLAQAPPAEGRPNGKIITMASIAGRPAPGRSPR